MFTSENNDDYDCSLLTYKEAVTGIDRRNWEKAIQSELYGELSDEVYMKLPVGYETNCNNSEVVCRLKKSLYGLKQAPFTWNKTFTQAMFDLGFKTIKTDRCVFINEDKSIIIGLFVDDGLVIGKDKKKIEAVLKKLVTVNLFEKIQVLIWVWK